MLYYHGNVKQSFQLMLILIDIPFQTHMNTLHNCTRASAQNSCAKKKYEPTQKTMKALAPRLKMPTQIYNSYYT